MNNATPALYYKNIVGSKEYSRFNMVEELLYSYKNWTMDNTVLSAGILSVGKGIYTWIDATM